MARPSLRTVIARMPSDRYAMIVAAIYALLGFFYIFVSDHVLAWFVRDPKHITWLQTLKGWAFIVLTGSLLFLVIRYGRERVRRTESRLREADAGFRRMVETTNDGVWTFDLLGKTEYVNAMMASLLGETQSGMIGRGVREFADPDVCRFLKQTLPGRLDDDALRFDCELRRSDGSTIWVLVSAALLPDASGRASGGMLMVRDITRRRIAEQAAERSAQAQRTLLNELDHRVRNNLSVLAALIDFSARDAVSVSDFAGSMSGRVQAMAKAHSLVSRVRENGYDFARLVVAMAPSSALDRVIVDGPPVSVEPGQISPLAMLLHELVARSERSGGLSHSDGTMLVRWSLRSSAGKGQSLVLQVREWPVDHAATDAPHADALIEGLTATGLGGQSWSFIEEGVLVHEITIPLNSGADTLHPRSDGARYDAPLSPLT